MEGSFASNFILRCIYNWILYLGTQMMTFTIITPSYHLAINNDYNGCSTLRKIQKKTHQICTIDCLTKWCRFVLFIMTPHKVSVQVKPVYTLPQLFPIGVQAITYIATDRSGNQANCSFTVTVIGESRLPGVWWGQKNVCPENDRWTGDTWRYSLLSLGFTLSIWGGTGG